MKRMLISMTLCVVSVATSAVSFSVAITQETAKEPITPFPSAGGAGSGASYSITIDPTQSMGQVSPYIFGQFIEYMGRDIEGGIYDPQSLRP